MRSIALALSFLSACDAGAVHSRTDDGGAHPRSDAGGTDASAPLADAGEASPLVFHVSPACADISVPHADAPLFGFEVSGPPGETIEIVAAKPSCGIAEFVYATLELDANGRATLSRNHAGTTDCADPLLGRWLVRARSASAESDPVELSLVSSSCGVSCESAGSFCPTPPSDAGVPDAGMPDAGPLDPSCTTLAEDRAFTSTEGVLRYTEAFPETANVSYRRVEVSLDVWFPAWSPKQGQYEVFSILRGRRWTGHAIGYVSFVGPANRAVVTTANLGLDGAAAPPGGDGRRASASYPFETMHTYHLAYAYDVDLGRRRLEVYDGEALVRTLEGEAFVDSIDVTSDGMRLVLGGEEVADAPDASTLGWRFTNVRVRACR